MHKMLFPNDSSTVIKNALPLAGSVAAHRENCQHRIIHSLTSESLVRSTHCTVACTKQSPFQPKPMSMLDGLRRSLETETA